MRSLSETRGNLGLTLQDYKSFGSSRSGYEHLIVGEIKLDVPLGEQMSESALKEYFSSQVHGLRTILALPEEQRKILVRNFGWQGFEADLPYLERREIDTTEAKDVLAEFRAAAAK